MQPKPVVPLINVVVSHSLPGTVLGPRCGENGKHGLLLDYQQPTTDDRQQYHRHVGTVGEEFEGFVVDGVQVVIGMGPCVQ